MINNNATPEDNCERFNDRYLLLLRECIDHAIYDPDTLFQSLARSALEAEDWHIEKLFCAMSALLDKQVGIITHHPDTLRREQVRHWVESQPIHYDDQIQITLLNSENKFNRQLGRLQLLLSCAISAVKYNQISVENLDPLKLQAIQIMEYLHNDREGINNSSDSPNHSMSHDLIDKEPLNSSHIQKRLLQKFASGDYLLSCWWDWYREPNKRLNSKWPVVDHNKGERRHV